MRKWVVLYPFLSILVLLWIEQGIEVTYIWKTLAKIILFVIVPLLYVRSTKSDFLNRQQVKTKHFIPAFFLGFFVLLTILIAFIVFQDIIDLAALKTDLETRVGVTASVFPFVA
ncbi:MAG: hypothetical protein ABWY25_05885, partial [Paenisporosarcina sp.]